MVDTVLGNAGSGRATFVKKALLAVAGTVFIALAAQIYVPFYPVPMTLQTLAVLIVGLTFGSRLGAATLALYLAEGAMGLPVFAGSAGVAALFGPTAGFLFGFIGMAWLAGFVVEKGIARNVLSTSFCCAVIALLLYVPGAAWPMAIAQAAGMTGTWVGATAGDIWAFWISPFVFGDLIKAVIAALMVCGGRVALKARQ